MNKFIVFLMRKMLMNILSDNEVFVKVTEAIMEWLRIDNYSLTRKQSVYVQKAITK